MGWCHHPAHAEPHPALPGADGPPGWNLGLETVLGVGGKSCQEVLWGEGRHLSWLLRGMAVAITVLNSDKCLRRRSPNDLVLHSTERGDGIEDATRSWCCFGKEWLPYHTQTAQVENKQKTILLCPRACCRQPIFAS